jgi:hypothetical protein
MALDTSIPLSNLLRPHIQSPAESFGFEQQVKQARFEDQQRQQKMQQDQFMRKMASDPNNLDPMTGGWKLDAIMKAGSVMGSEWTQKAVQGRIGILDKVSEMQSRADKDRIQRAKLAASWQSDIYKRGADKMQSIKKTGASDAEAYAQAKTWMMTEMENMRASGQALTDYGADDAHVERYKGSIPNSYDEMLAAGMRINELSKSLEAMQTGQPAPAPAAPEGPQIGVPKQQGEPQVTTLADTSAGNVPAQQPTAQTGAVTLDKIEQAPTLVEENQPEVNSAKLRKQAKDEETKADEEQKAGRINNAKTLRAQAKEHMSEADRLVKQAQTDDRLAQNAEKEARLKEKDKQNVLKAEINQSALPQDTVDRIAKQVVAGDHQAMVGLAKNQKALAQVMDGVTKEMQRQGKTPVEISQATANYRALTAAAKTTAIQEANIGGVIEELKMATPIAERALQDVTRTGFKPVNEIIKISASNWSPEEKAFMAANRTLQTYYSQIISRGAPTVHSSEEAEKLLNTADSPEMYRATIAMIRLEADIALEAKRKFRKSLLSEMTGEEKKIFEPIKEYEKVIEAMRKSPVGGIPKPVTPMGAGTQPPKTIKWNDLR